MYIEPNLVFLTVVFLALCAAGGWGVLLGEARQRQRAQERVFTQPTGRWSTVRFPDIPADAVKTFIAKWERRGFQFVDETRANGASHSTLFMKQWIGV